MSFINNFIICLVVVEIFFFFGRGLLLDLNTSYYGTGAVCAFVIAVLLSVYEHQEAKIEALEERIKALEGKDEAEL